MYHFWLSNLASVRQNRKANSLKYVNFLKYTHVPLFLLRVFLVQRNVFGPHFNLSNLSDHDPLKTVEYETLLLSLFNIQLVRYLTFVTNVFLLLKCEKQLLREYLFAVRV